MEIVITEMEHNTLNEACGAYEDFSFERDGFYIHNTETLYSVDLESIVQEKYNISYAQFVGSKASNPGTIEVFVKGKIEDAMVFGQALLIDFAKENVMMGITQLGKTKVVVDYLKDVMRYVQSGSLYEVINEIDLLMSEGLPEDLAPFVTEERLIIFKSKVENYLQG